MSFREAINLVYKFEESKPKDYWKDIAEIPLFTKRPYDDYEKEIPDEDIFTYKIDTRDAQSRTAFNGLVCASTGVGKDRLIKNIIKGFHKEGYKILHFEPKGYEFLNARFKGKGRRLAPNDKNESLPVVGYCPNYIRPILTKNEDPLLRLVKFYSPQIEKLDYPEVWQSLGVPIKMATMIVEAINKGHANLDYFYKDILKMKMDKARHHSTITAATGAIDTLKASLFFGTTKKLELEKEWAKGNIVNAMYMSRDGALMNTDIGLILDQVRDIGIKESRLGLRNISKKLLIFNDAFYYAGMSAKLGAPEGINLAIRNINNCQNNFRTWGIDTLFIVQSPDSNNVIPSLIDGCTTKFVSYIENPSALSSKLPYDAFRLLSSNRIDEPSLYVNEDSYIYQWIYVKGKTRWVTGFPFDCTVGHS